MRTTAGAFRRAALGSGESHAKRSNHFAKLANLFARASYAMDPDDDEELHTCFAEIAGELNGLAHEHARRAEDQLNEAKSYPAEPDETENENGDKAARSLADLRKGVMDDHVSVVTPTAPVRPVFRSGQREFVPNARPAGDVMRDIFKIDGDLW